MCIVACSELKDYRLHHTLLHDGSPTRILKYWSVVSGLVLRNRQPFVSPSTDINSHYYRGVGYSILYILVSMICVLFRVLYSVVSSLVFYFLSLLWSSLLLLDLVLCYVILLSFLPFFPLSPSLHPSLPLFFPAFLSLIPSSYHPFLLSLPPSPPSFLTHYSLLSLSLPLSFPPSLSLSPSLSLRPLHLTHYLSFIIPFDPPFSPPPSSISFPACHPVPIFSSLSLPLSSPLFLCFLSSLHSFFFLIYIL